MSYSACVYGGGCTGCMRCQEEERYGFEHETFEGRRNRVLAEVAEYYKSRFDLLLDLIEFRHLVGEYNTNFADAAARAEISDDEVVLPWPDGVEIYTREEVDGWTMSDIIDDLNIWHEDVYMAVLEARLEKNKALPWGRA